MNKRMDENHLPLSPVRPPVGTPSPRTRRKGSASSPSLLAGRDLGRGKSVFLLTVLLVGGALIALSLVIASGPAAAQDGGTPPTESDDSYCLLCHAQPGQEIALPDGSTLDISVDPAALAHSVHGTDNPMGPLGCTACHGDMRFPHQEPLPANQRALTLDMTGVCATCHTEQAAGQADSVHANALLAGNPHAATCVDCHGAHDITPPDEPRTRISETCGTCHTIAFGEYRQSVHGQALYAGDPNVPTCIDCHGVHSINHPTTGAVPQPLARTVRRVPRR